MSEIISKSQPKIINTVTVIGANGTMGARVAAIFASFGNAKVYLVSRSIEKSIDARNKTYLSVRAESIKEKMIPSDYEHLEELCCFVFSYVLCFYVEGCSDRCVCVHIHTAHQLSMGVTRTR